MPDPAPAPSGLLSWTRSGEVLVGVTGLHGAAALAGLGLGLPELAAAGAALAGLSLVALLAYRRSARIPVDAIGIAGVVAHGLVGTIALGTETGAQGFLLVLPALALVDQELPWASRIARAMVATGVYAAFVGLMAETPPLWRLPADQLAVLAELGRVAAFVTVGALSWAAAQSQERRRSRDRRAAETDPLTGVLRRSAVLERARQLRGRLPATTPVAVAIVDVEGLPAARLLGGQDARDRLLQETVTRLESCLRTDDLIGRLGPAELVLVLSGLDGRRGWQVLDRLHAAAGRTVVMDDGRALDSQLRIGLVQWEREEFIEETIARADAAVYRDRGGGAQELAS